MKLGAYSTIFIGVDSEFLFYLVSYNLSVLSLILMLRCSRLGQWECLPAGFHVLLTRPHHSLSIFLLSDRTRHPRLILYLTLKTTISLSTLAPVTREWQLEAKIWALDGHSAIRVSRVQAFSVDRVGDTVMHTHGYRSVCFSAYLSKCSEIIPVQHSRVHSPIGLSDGDKSGSNYPSHPTWGPTPLLRPHNNCYGFLHCVVRSPAPRLTLTVLHPGSNANSFAPLRYQDSNRMN